MGRPVENMIVLQSEKFDIGNTGANVAVILVPVQCVVDSASGFLLAAATANCHVSLDSLSNATQGAEDIGSLEFAASTAAFATKYDLAGRGVRLKAGDKILIQVDDAGDSGEFAKVCVSAIYEPETEANQTSSQTVTA